MRTIGVQELEFHLREALAAVAAGEVIAVTNDGQRVALIVPAPGPDPQVVQDELAELDRFADEIAPYFPAGLTVQDILNDIRR